MSQVYNHLEPKYNQNKNILDGCHWFNCDVGVFGLPEGSKVISGYMSIFKTLAERNIIVEKFQIADLVYNKLYNGVKKDYDQVELELTRMNFKTILITLPEDLVQLKKRIEDRLNLYPHYKRILKEAEWYLRQQTLYREEIAKSRLPFLEIATTELPDDKLVKKILNWIGED